MCDQQSTSLVRAHVLISGRVQGVGYRFFTRQQARQLKLTGWVRNLPTNEVEAVFEGDRSTVEQMLHWCQCGSPDAEVKQVQVKFSPAQGIEDFQIIY